MPSACQSSSRRRESRGRVVQLARATCEGNREDRIIEHPWLTPKRFQIINWLKLPSRDCRDFREWPKRGVSTLPATLACAPPVSEVVSLESSIPDWSRSRLRTCTTRALLMPRNRAGVLFNPNERHKSPPVNFPATSPVTSATDSSVVTYRVSIRISICSCESSGFVKPTKHQSYSSYSPPTDSPNIRSMHRLRHLLQRGTRREVDSSRIAARAELKFPSRILHR